jgi:hypothetical protein
MIKRVPLERKRRRAAYPDEFDDGDAIGSYGKVHSARDPSGGGYPLGFHAWSIDRRNAWFCGFNLRYVKRPAGRSRDRSAKSATLGG